MFAQYFGQYLLSQGHLTSTQLYEALTAQKDARPKLGVLAINHGWMTGSQVEEVHAEQMSRDKRFGEIAVEQGYLTEEQVQELLLSQKSEHLLLGQTLIDQGLMTYDSFSEVLGAFKEAYSLSSDQFSSILQGNVDALVSAVLLKDGLPAGEWLSGYVSLFAKNLIRFADTGVRLEMAIAPRPSVYDWVFSQEITAEGTAEAGYTAVAGSQESMLRLASRFAQETDLRAGRAVRSGGRRAAQPAQRHLPRQYVGPRHGAQHGAAAHGPLHPGRHARQASGDPHLRYGL
ncbi:hypothetical protein PM3016_5644 [Paenibacillus mucilaginosus 3016]|uniref:Bacteriophage N4 adsorption protein B n=1 Tax=Paenibacillus mucilaginosus 3016 TaxID=1116391 RepID=H6NKE3_9BACL|nr:hypothetical protein [Paenibacillus mucilaginosus]AFC32334.1 hypothetical protein PM3016_5644 [Paenibacillus mucilaginosus 3016]